MFSASFAPSKDALLFYLFQQDLCRWWMKHISILLCNMNVFTRCGQYYWNRKSRSIEKLSVSMREESALTLLRKIMIHFWNACCVLANVLNHSQVKVELKTAIIQRGYGYLQLAVLVVDDHVSLHVWYLYFIVNVGFIIIFWYSFIPWSLCRWMICRNN